MFLHRCKENIGEFQNSNLLDGNKVTDVIAGITGGNCKSITAVLRKKTKLITKHVHKSKFTTLENSKKHKTPINHEQEMPRHMQPLLSRKSHCVAMGELSGGTKGPITL